MTTLISGFTSNLDTKNLRAGNPKKRANENMAKACYRARERHALRKMVSITKKRILMVAIPALLLVAAGLVLLYLQYREQLPPPGQWRPLLADSLQRVPVPLFFCAFVVLPALGVPLTVFYLTAIPVMGTVHPAIGVVFGWLAVSLNMVLTYFLAQGILHPVIERIVRRRGLSVPKLSPENEWKIVLAFRLSPMPFFLQNYVLALGKARWKTYLFISMLIQGAIGMAVMLLGESILTGGLGYVLLAACFFILLNLFSDYIRKRLNRDPAKPQ